MDKGKEALFTPFRRLRVSLAPSPSYVPFSAAKMYLTGSIQTDIERRGIAFTAQIILSPFPCVFIYWFSLTTCLFCILCLMFLSLFTCLFCLPPLVVSSLLLPFPDAVPPSAW